MTRHSPLIRVRPFLFRGPVGRAIEMSMTWSAMRCCGVEQTGRWAAVRGMAGCRRTR
jgi:hypothetical protein